jgi:hypothetical protein
MSNRGLIRSFTESHCADVSRPDRGNFYPKPSGLRPQRHFSGDFPNHEAGIGNPPGQFPISFNKAANTPPSAKREMKFLHAGSHTFYSFIPGRETE